MVQLAACAPRQAPVILPGEPILPLHPPAPAWLPDGWVEERPGAGTETDSRVAIAVYTPAGAAAPLLLVAHYPPATVATWTGAERLDPVRWLTDGAVKAVSGFGVTVGEPTDWRRDGLADGRRVDVTGQWPDGYRGSLQGTVALARLADGGVVAAAALAPAGDNTALIEELLRALPADPSALPAVEPQAVQNHAD